MSPVARYIHLALQPDVEGLTELIRSTIDEIGPLACYDGLIRPALAEVGARWERDELTVGDEHLITALTEQLLAGLATGHGRSHHVAVAGCTPGNRHRVGLLMVADALGLAGWQPIVLGAETPTQDLIHIARRHDAELVALSVGLDGELEQLTSQLEEVRSALGDHVAILVGGGPLARRPAWQTPPQAIHCSSAAEARAEADRILRRVGSHA